MAERKPSSSGTGAAGNGGARTLQASLVNPRLVRGLLRAPANDNPVPPARRVRRALTLAVLAALLAAGLASLIR